MTKSGPSRNRFLRANQGHRLQKVLAQHGYGSRREIETWIEHGRVKINGKLAQLGDRYDPKDQITLDDKPLQLQREEIETKVILYHKPIGEISSRSDKHHDKTVFDNLPVLTNAKWINIGRLDINSSGLMLFTNNGTLAHKLMHPSSNLLRVYQARALGPFNERTKQRLLDGLQLTDGFAKFHTCKKVSGTGKNNWYEVSIAEGRNREVRRLFDAVGLRVNKLVRCKYGPIFLPRDLKPGQFCYLPQHLLQKLSKYG